MLKLSKLIPILLLPLSLFSVSATATEDLSTSLVFGGLSYHLSDRDYNYQGETFKYNEVNPSFGLQVGEMRWVMFENSYGKSSNAFLWVPKLPMTPNLSMGTRLGLTTGYKDTPQDSELLPIIGLELDYQVGNLHIIPAIQLPGVATLHIQWDL